MSTQSPSAIDDILAEHSGLERQLAEITAQSGTPVTDVTGTVEHVTTELHYSKAQADAILEDFLAGGKVTASDTLSPREREVIQLVAEGQTNKAIADRWSVSVKTVETHRTAAMRKLNLRSGVELALYAVRNKLIEP